MYNTITLFELIRNQLIDKYIKIYRYNLSIDDPKYRYSLELNSYYYDNDTGYHIINKKILDVIFYDGEYDQWPSIEIITDGDLNHHDLRFDVPLNCMFELKV